MVMVLSPLPPPDPVVALSLPPPPQPAIVMATAPVSRSTDIFFNTVGGSFLYVSANTYSGVVAPCFFLYGYRRADEVLALTLNSGGTTNRSRDRA
ncbi:hypothetical protein Psi01_41980 [Planobispora siamensis]|uniref:Uncharacterized protein n=1 Tax=Planobispora siamensis TaxID=936338 RepID=A0A8J3SPZ4_9ACTN|nr:hypothetical protein Psi01_41980 [Planobispora siamensis]